ncbi:MAG: hypothetical protein E6H08_07690 [Bacteroidetes bacterium]|nr:MAG: hypothetical protein E6H08_07690 [Bacteroidota bacterium]
MTPQKTFRISLAAIMICSFMLAPISSREAIQKSKRISFNTQQQVVDEGSSKQANNIDLTIPLGDKKEKEKNNNHNEDQPKAKHHSDEEKHKNHVYHYHRLKAKKKIHTTFLQLCMKIFIAISFISVLLCGYLSIGH